MEAGALNPSAAAIPGIGGRSPLLRLQSDEKLIALIRKGQHGAFEALVQRYQSRLLAFCRHMLGSTEDAEDVLQEVFAAAFNAICADNRPINARPWLYRIARNRCLNHLRRPVPNGQDSMDVFERDGGQTTADAVHKREEFRQIVADVQELPETQRTALLLREMDALSYEHIAEAMDTTVPSVKSLLVRARVSLAEAAEARLLSCAEVRLELGEVAEGLVKLSPPARRHVKSCERCYVFRGELRKTNRALAAVYPFGPLIIFKKLLLTKLGLGAGATTSGSGAGVAGAAAGGGSGAGGALTAGFGAIATKAAAGFAAAAIVTAGAVETSQQSGRRYHSNATGATASNPTAAPGLDFPAGFGAQAARPLPAALHTSGGHVAHPTPAPASSQQQQQQQQQQQTPPPPKQKSTAQTAKASSATLTQLQQNSPSDATSKQDASQPGSTEHGGSTATLTSGPSGTTDPGASQGQPSSSDQTSSGQGSGQEQPPPQSGGDGPAPSQPAGPAGTLP